MSENRKNPFPGLRPFQYEEFELFFGRDQQYDQMIRKLSETRFLAVVGTSGSGKSSLVKAGLYPALYGGQMQYAGPCWRIAEFRPKDDPIGELALALNHKRVFGDKPKEKGSSLFRLNESTNWGSLCARLNRANEGERSPSGRVLAVLSSEDRLLLSGAAQNGDAKKDPSKIVQVFNGVLKQRDFYQEADFKGVKFSSEINELLTCGQQSLTEDEIEKLNRLVLETSFPEEIARKIESQAHITEVTLRRGDLGLIEVAREAKMEEDENLLVVVDQFEELFRYAKISENGPHGNQAAAFVKLLLQASAQTDIPIYVVLTMRSDYLGDCAKFWGLPEAINKGQYLIPRLTRDQRREAIQGPISLRGAKITPQLVNQLLNDMGDDPDQLPILQHALMRTWDEWEKTSNPDKPIDMTHYTTIGKMAEALSNHADEAYEELPDDDSREIAERVFRCLAERGTGHSEVRRPTRVSELLDITGATFEELNSVINVFRKEGRSFLLPAARKPLRKESLIDISHESLIRNWKKLRKWVNREADSANVYRRLVQTAKLYELNQVGPLTDLEIEYALRWKDENKPNLAWASRYHLSLTRDEKTTETTNGQEEDGDKKIFEGVMNFLEESQDVSQKKARTRKLTKILVVASVFLLVMVPLLVLQILRMNTESRVRARLTYSAEMKLAQQQLEKGNFAEVNRLLHDAPGTQAQAATLNSLSWDRLFPPQDDTALRGFEWHHFWKLTHNETSTIGRYENAIISLAYLNGSDTLAVAESKGEILLWDPTKGNLPIKSSGAPPEVSLVAFASDRKSVAIAQQNGSIGLWELSADLTRLTAKRELRAAQRPPVDSIAYSPDGRYVVAAMPGSVTIWSVIGDEKPYPIPFGSSDKTNHVSLAFSADSRWLAIGLDQIAKVVEVSTKKELPEINLAFSVENSTSSPPNAPVNNQRVSQHAQTPSKPAAPITCLAFSSPNGQILAMGRRDTNITLWDLNTNRYLLSLKGHFMEVLALVFSEDREGVLASASRDGGIKIWNMKKLYEPGDSKTKEEILRQTALTLNGHSGPVTALAFGRDQKTLVSASEDRSLKQWSINAGPPAKYDLGQPSPDRVSSLSFSADNVWLAAGRYDGSATLWNVKTNQSAMELPPARSVEKRVTPVAFWKEQILAVATEEQQPSGVKPTITLFQMNNSKPAVLRVLSNGHIRPVLTLAFSPDGKWLATGGADKSVMMWEVATGNGHLVTALPDSDAVLSLAFSPDGETLAIGTNKSTVVLWDLTRKKEAGFLNGHADAVTSIAFSNDVIATGSWDTTAKLWNAKTHECFATFRGHSQRVLSVSFFTDGKRLATAGEDGSVNLWDTSYETGEEEDSRNALIAFPLKEGTIPAFIVATSPDRLILATGNINGTVSLRFGADPKDIETQSKSASVDN